MKFKKATALGLITVIAMASGCGLKPSNELEATPIPEATPTPVVTATPVPQETATPVPQETATPTPTPAALAIGTQTDTSAVVPVNNDLGAAISELYLATGGSYEWGENLLNGNVLAAGGSAELYYDPSMAGDYGYYDIKLVLEDGTEYYTMSLTLADMKDMTFYINDEDKDSWVRYTSAADGEQKDTRDDWVAGSIADVADTSDTSAADDTAVYDDTYAAGYDTYTYDTSAYDTSAYNTYDTGVYDNVYTDNGYGY